MSQPESPTPPTPTTRKKRGLSYTYFAGICEDSPVYSFSNRTAFYEAVPFLSGRFAENNLNFMQQQLQGIGASHPFAQTNLKLIRCLDQLASKPWAPTVLLAYLTLGSQACAACLAFYVGARDSNSGPDAYTESRSLPLFTSRFNTWDTIAWYYD